MSNVHFYTAKKDEDVTSKNTLCAELESKLDELKVEMLLKIEKELTDSQNARMFISQKYDELVNKISGLTDLDATVTGFRTDVKTIEKQILELSTRVDDMERRAGFTESSFASNLLQ